jgi:hypothetical protein
MIIVKGWKPLYVNFYTVYCSKTQLWDSEYSIDLRVEYAIIEVVSHLSRLGDILVVLFSFPKLSNSDWIRLQKKVELKTYKSYTRFIYTHKHLKSEDQESNNKKNGEYTGQDTQLTQPYPLFSITNLILFLLATNLSRWLKVEYCVHLLMFTCIEKWRSAHYIYFVHFRWKGI